MDDLVHYKPVGISFLNAYPWVMEQLHKVECLKFFESLTRYEIEVTKAFSKSFYGVEKKIGDIRLNKTKSFSIEATEQIPY